MKPTWSTAAVVFVLAACSAPTAQRPPTVTSTTGATAKNAETESVEPAADAAPLCELACGNAVALSTGTTSSPDHHADAVANVDQVFSSMHDDLLACYRARLSANAQAHAFVRAQVVLNPDGSVRSVNMTGGAMLGEAGLSCLTRRIERATFAPVHGGGTLRVEVPLEFRRLGPGEIQ